MSQVEKIKEVEEETLYITTFEDHVREIQDAEARRMQKVMWIPTSIVWLSVIVIMFGLEFLVRVLVWDPILAIAVVVLIGVGVYEGYSRWRESLVDFLRGKKVLDIVIRIRRGFFIDDWAIVREGYPKQIKLESAKDLGFPKTLIGDNAIFNLWEYVFDGFPYFDRMIVPLHKDIPHPDRLSDFQPGSMFFKNFIVTAEKAKLTYGLLKVIKYGPEGYIPFVFPIDNDLAIEHLQQISGLFNLDSIDKKTVEALPYYYDSYRGLEAQAMVRQREKELMVKNKEGEDIEVRSRKMAANLYHKRIEATPKGERTIGLKGMWRWVSKHKVIIAILVLSSVIMLLTRGFGYFG